jgi:hypothetical protein
VTKRVDRAILVGVSIGLSVSTAASGQQQPHPQTTEQLASQPSDKLVDLEAIARDARRALAPYSTDSGNFAKRVLYTWTTKEQVEELRATRLLLSRSESPEFGLSGFDKRIAVTPGPMTELLQRPELTMRRFAWPAAWGTALGFGGERYGDQLIRVTLKETAIVAAFTSGHAEPWKLTDLSGAEVPIETLREHPESLAAVYYEAIGDSGQLLYREYVLCNESMIETWEYATPQVSAELVREEDALRKLIEWMKVAIDKEEAARVFAATAAFPGFPYIPEIDSLAELANTMHNLTVEQSGPLNVTPTVAFHEISSNLKPRQNPAGIPPPCLPTLCARFPSDILRR